MIRRFFAAPVPVFVCIVAACSGGAAPFVTVPMMAPDAGQSSAKRGDAGDGEGGVERNELLGIRDGGDDADDDDAEVLYKRP